jgi:hypothetical protein
MADKIGIRREWFKPKSSPYYDVSLERKELVLKYGVVIPDRKNSRAN